MGFVLCFAGTATIIFNRAFSYTVSLFLFRLLLQGTKLPILFLFLTRQFHGRLVKFGLGRFGILANQFHFTGAFIAAAITASINPILISVAIGCIGRILRRSATTRTVRCRRGRGRNGRIIAVVVVTRFGRCIAA